MNQGFRQKPTAQTFKLRYQAVLSLAVFAFLVSTSVSLASTTHASRDFIEVIRVIAAVTVFGCTAFVIGASQKLPRRALYALAMYLFIVTYAAAISSLFGNFSFINFQMAFNILITSAGILIFSSLRSFIIPKNVATWFIAFATAMLALTALVDGISFTYPPRFFIEYSPTARDADLLYSQGLSRFFGYAAIFSIFAGANSTSTLVRNAFFTLCLGFLALSFLGGARGDSIGAAFIVIVYAAFSFPLRAIAAAVLVALLTFYWLPWYLLDDFIIFQRILALSDNFGSRDFLFVNSVTLLVEQPGCLALGCGFDYFQDYFGYRQGLYPHNFFLEAIITWGLPLVLFIGAGAVLGMRLYFRERGYLRDALFLHFSYSLLVSLKSGSSMSAWVVMAACFLFWGLAAHSLFTGTLPQIRKQAASEQGR